MGIAQLPVGLVSERAALRLSEIPDLLPPAFAAGAFECRLHPDGGPIDFTCGLYRGRCQWALRYAWAEAGWTAGDDPAWDGAAALLGCWADTSSSLHQALDEIWLEFDLGGAGRPRPFVYVTPIQGDVHFGREGDAEVVALAARCLQLLGALPSKRTLSVVRRCVRSLPAAGRFLQFAPLGHRRPDTVRLVIALPAGELAAYLARIGWPGEPDQAAEVFRSAGDADWVSPLQLDVSDEVLPPISREFCDRTAPREDARWDRLLDELQGIGACDPDRRVWLEDWPTGQDAPVFRREQPLQVSRLLQVKVQLVPGRPVRAKAYMGFQPKVGLFR